MGTGKDWRDPCTNVGEPQKVQKGGEMVSDGEVRSVVPQTM